MKGIKAIGTGVMMVVLAGLLGGCGASYQARSVDLNATLVNPAMLQKGADGQALYRYVNPRSMLHGTPSCLSSRSRLPKMATGRS